jgi:diguanylate cyclase (GGDEF)-like protein
MRLRPSPSPATTGPTATGPTATGPTATGPTATEPAAAHPRVLGWPGTVAMAMGGSNQSLFIIGAVIVAQGSAAIPLLLVGLLLAWAALPGWTELICMFPNRVGGIAAACAEAFRPYSPVLANLTGVSYWWGWIPTCGLTAILSADALHTWYLPMVPTHLLATGFVLAFTAINLRGIRWATRTASTIGAIAGTLAFGSAIFPVATGRVDWHQAGTWHLHQPFSGTFGALTSAMAGLYLIGFAAPAFEAAACHVGETRNFARNVPRAMFGAALMATLYFAVLPVVWLGALGPHALGGDLTNVLGPTFAPLTAAGAKAAAIWFMVFNMFHGTLQPLAGAARTLSQLADDGLLPRSLSRRNRHDAPVVATLVTAGFSIAFLLSDDPPSIIAAANFTYLLGICLPSVAVWLLRRNHPDWDRPWRAPRGTIVLGVLAAIGWAASTIFGFEQFGLTYVLLALGMAYSGVVAYGWRQWRDRGSRRTFRGLSLHAKLTGAMVAVMALDGAGYLLAVQNVRAGDEALVVVLQDIFVTVALLTVSVGLVLPGIISHAVTQVGAAARILTNETLPQLTSAMIALGEGRTDDAHVTPPELRPIEVHSADEVAEMANNVNAMQRKVIEAAKALDQARVLLQTSRAELRFLAEHDSLTGIGNRRRFDDVLAAQIDHNRRYGTTSAVVLIDLDDFKVINDTRGHAVGDAVLKRVADVLTDRLRSTDFLARLGGDEYAVIVPSATLAQAQKLAQSLIEDVGDRAIIIDDQGHRVRVRASAGVTTFGGTLDLTAGGVLTDVDVAMYDAKESGRNRVAVADSSGERREQLATRQEWADTIRDALDNDRFVLYAQPIVEIATGEVTCHELLLRLVKDGEVRAPGAFLAIAERVGLIGEIDQMVIRQAFTLVRSELAAGRPAHYSINLSGTSITNVAVIDLIERELADGNVPGACFTFEITETAAIHDIDRARDFATRLRDAGCGLALDDFGSGFGSFYYLKHLPFTYLKIDGDFVRRLPTSRHDQHVVKALVDVAHGLGLRTVAEFVEDAEILEQLRGLDVTYAQGYHLGRPMPLAGPVPTQRSASMVARATTSG